MRTFISRALEKLDKLTTEQIKELIKNLVEENRRLESVLESLDSGLLVCDAEGLVIFYNKAAERLLGLTATDHLEKDFAAMVEDPDLKFFLAETVREGNRIEDRDFDITAHGQERLLSLSVFPLVSAKRVTGTVVHVKDITERRIKEARLRRAENLASLTNLTAGVAHEIKNPLGAISIHIQLIQKALIASCTTSEHIDSYLNVINEEIARLNHIVVDFLFAVRPMDMRLRKGDINELIRELIAFVQPELEKNRIMVELSLSEAVPFFLYDERYIKQALLNLIKNAQAAMPTGGRLAVKTEVDGSFLYISCTDTGIGIPDENLEKIFDPYFTTTESGSGLGLTMTYKIIKEHQGELSLKSHEGEGTVFTIVLPLPQKETKLISWQEVEE